jgi:hypothetical protein
MISTPPQESRCSTRALISASLETSQTFNWSVAHRNVQRKDDYLNLNLVGRWYQLFKFGRSFLESWSRDVCHKDIGTFFGEENACFEADTTYVEVSELL